VLELDRSQSKLAAPRAFIRELYKSTIYAKDLEITQKLQRASLFAKDQRIWAPTSIGKDTRKRSRSICTKPREDALNACRATSGAHIDNEIAYKIYVHLNLSKFYS